MITKEQYGFLTQGIQPNRVSQKQGQSHLEAWDIRRHLIRVFGFGGFDIERRDLALVKEIETPPDKPNGKTRWTVVYRVELRLIIKGTGGKVIAYFDDGATGDAINMPSVGDAHDFALKTAYSQALKRCAVNLGDQFGLSLYNGGKTDPVVHRSLVTPEGTPAAPPPADTEPVQPEPTPETAPGPEPESEAQPESKPGPDPGRLRDWALDKTRTAAGLDQARQRLTTEHPDVAGTTVVNETGDEEQLGELLSRRARELAPPGGENGQAEDRDERRRKRMHALFTEKGYAARADRLSLCALVTGRDIESTKELTHDQVERVIAALERHDAANTPIGASA